MFSLAIDKAAGILYNQFILYIRGSVMQKRSIPVCIILSILTCNLYGIYWFICLTDEANALSGDHKTSGGMAFLLTLITCNIYGIYWAYKMGEKLDMVKRARGIPSSDSGVLYLILALIFPLAGWALMQNEINKLIDGPIYQ